MTTLRKAAQQALEALDKQDAISGYPNYKKQRKALRAALAQPEQEPLTDDQIAEICMDCSLVTPCDIYYARAIERAHGIGGEE